MANKYGSPEPSYEKCLNPKCNNQVRRMPNHIKRGTKKFCSTKCLYATSRPVKYTTETFELIMAFRLTHSYADFAAHLGMTEGAVKKMVCTMRMAGYPIPIDAKKTRRNVGDMRKRTSRGKTYDQVLTPSGWRTTPSDKRLGERTGAREVKK